MDRFKNEQGAALVLTLFIVTMMLLFVLTQFYQVTNTSKQVTTMGKNIDARNVAEMGIEYCQQKYKIEREHLEQIMDEEGMDELMVEIEKINGQMQEEAPGKLPGVIDDNRSFDVNAEIEEELENPDSDVIIITCTSIGTAFGKPVTVEGNIKIKLVED